MQNLKLGRDHPLLLPGGSCFQQLLPQVGHLVLQACYHRVFVFRFKFKIGETADFFSQQQNYFILGGGQMGNLLGVGLGVRLSPFKERQEKYGIILWEGEGRQGGKKQTFKAISVTWKIS